MTVSQKTETLRLWPALANGTYREIEKDEIITGYDDQPVTLEKGTYCQIINWTRNFYCGGKKKFFEV